MTLILYYHKHIDWSVIFVPFIPILEDKIVVLVLIKFFAQPMVNATVSAVGEIDPVILGNYQLYMRDNIITNFWWTTAGVLNNNWLRSEHASKYVSLSSSNT